MTINAPRGLEHLIKTELLVNGADVVAFGDLRKVHRRVSAYAEVYKWREGNNMTAGYNRDLQNQIDLLHTALRANTTLYSQLSPTPPP